MKIKDVVGGFDVAIEYDRAKQQIVSINSVADYKATMSIQLDKTKDPKESKIEERVESKFSDFKFEGIETVVVSEDSVRQSNAQKALEDLKNSDNIEDLQKKVNEQLKNLDKALEDFKKLEEQQKQQKQQKQ